MSKKCVDLALILVLVTTGLGLFLFDFVESHKTSNVNESSIQIVSRKRLAGNQAPRFELGKSNINRDKFSTLALKKQSTITLQKAEPTIFTKPVFTIQEKPLGKLSMTQHTASAIELKYQNGSLQEFLTSDTTSLIIPLEDGREVEARIEEVIYRGENTVSLRGQVGDEATSEVLMVFHDGAISGSIAFYATNEHYEMGLSGDGHIAVRKLDPDSYEDGCACENADQVDEMQLDSLPDALPEVSNDVVAADVVDYSIDSVIGYDSGSRILEGGVAGIEAKIILAVDRVNTVFQNSGIDNTEMVLLGMVEDPNYVFPGRLSSDMGTFDELGELDSTFLSGLNTVSDLRTQLGADHQGFIVEASQGGTAGIARRPGRSMIVSRTAMNSVNFTFVHELGHNIGCRHAWGDTDYLTSGSNYGWRFISSGGTQNRTVMAYDGDPGSWPRVPYFSTLSTSYNGASLGAPNGYDASSDSTVDPNLVTFTDDGTTYSGFNGANANLGARNAEYITVQSRFLADNSNRPETATLRVTDSNNTWLESGVSALDFSSTTLGQTTSHSLTLSNIGGIDLTGISLSLSGTDSSDFSISSVISTLVPYDSVHISVNHTSAQTGSLSGILTINADQANFTIPLTGSIRQEQLELSDDFQAGIGDWVHSTGYDFNWRTISGSTPSSSTGPSSGDQGTSWYIFTEGSNPNNPGKTAGIEKQYDFSDLTEVAVQFSYHMYGSHIGSIHLDIFDGTWHESIWSITGEQQSSSSEGWKTALVDLSSYADEQNGIRLRFRGITGSSFRSDMAIDQVKILAVPASATLTDWYTQYGLTGTDATPLATPMQDGVSNLEKFAFNMNPTVAGNYTLDPGTGESGLPLIDLTGSAPSEFLSIEYLRRKNAPEINYIVLFGDVPGEDDGGSFAENVTDINPNWERVIATDSQTTETKDKRFGTVKVEVAE